MVRRKFFPCEDDISFTLMPLTEMVHDWHNQKELVEMGEFADDTPKSAKGIREDWWNVNWIPFAANGGGDYFCIDLAPAVGGTKGQVISHNHETGEHKKIARSLRVWLHQLAYDLRDGKHTYDEDEGLT